MHKYGLREFEDLKTSTSTIMVYTNIIFNTRAIFPAIDIFDVDTPLTKKQKNVDKKKVTSPYGTVISVQSTTKIRGADLRKKKKRWCTICCPYKPTTSTTSGDKEVPLLTITEYLINESEGKDDIWTVKFYCSKCQKSYDPLEIKKINHFLNQLTIVLSVGTKPILNIMMFKDNIKIAGCKNIDDAAESVIILWQDYLVKNPTLWRLKSGAKTPRFQFWKVMKNVDFNLGFNIERTALNILMNDEKYADRVFMSQYESTGQTNVNIKMYSEKPADFMYDCLVMPFGSAPYFVKIPEITYKKVKKPKDGEYVTFIVFSSSEIILSGRYDKNMKEMYEFFVKLAFANKRKIEEVINNPNSTKITKIKYVL